MKFKWILIALALVLVLGLIAMLTDGGGDSGGGLLGGGSETETETETEAAPGKNTETEKLPSTETEVPTGPCSHTYGTATVALEATCGYSGLKTSTCTKCGAVKNEIIPKLEEHALNSYYDTFEGCQKVRNYVCDNCSYIRTEGLDIYVHNYVNGKCITCEAVDPNYDPDDGGDDGDPCARGEHDLYTVEEHEGCDYHDAIYCRNCDYLDFGESEFRHSYSSNMNMTHSCSVCGDTESCYSDDDPLCDVCGAALN